MVLQVGTTQFQSTAGQSSRTPVETFVEPVSVLPETGLMGLAETLQTINPTLQRFVNFKIDQAKQEGILEGQNLLLGADDKELTQIKKELSEKKRQQNYEKFCWWKYVYRVWNRKTTCYEFRKHSRRQD